MGLLLLSVSAFAQYLPKGMPFINNYPHEAYKAGAQNWSIINDKRNVMYFANNSGLLEFDGKYWNVYEVPNKSVVRAVLFDGNSHIYVGAFEEFGYFEPDFHGKLSYVSLSDSLQASVKSFDEIWKIHNTHEGIYFQSFKSLFVYRNNTISPIVTDRNLMFSFVVNDRLFVQDRKTGLFEYFRGKLRKIAENAAFGDDEIWSMLPLDSTTIIIGTAKNGLFLYNDISISAWNTEISEELKKSQLFSSEKINDNAFAFGTIQNGLLIANKNGFIEQSINKSKGLQNNTVLTLYKQSDKLLWLGLDNGLATVEINSPFFLYNEGLGLNGRGYTSALFENKLYVGTNQGIYYTTMETENTMAAFKFVENSGGQVWNLEIIGNTLFCGHNKGTFIIENNIAKRIGTYDGGWTYRLLPGHDNLLISGTYSGLVKYEKKSDNTWVQRSKLVGFKESSRFIEFDSDGNLWVSHGYKGLFRLQLNAGADTVLSVKVIGKDFGLASNITGSLYKLNNKLLYSTSIGVYVFDENKQKFELDSGLNKLSNYKGIFSPKTDSKGNLVYFENGLLHYAVPETNGNYHDNTTYFKRFAQLPVTSFEHVSVIADTTLFIGNEKGFIGFSKLFKQKNNDIFNVLIREIKSAGGKDTTFYFGTNFTNEKTDVLEIPFSLNSIKIKYSAAFYAAPEKTQYSVMLKGFDKRWSAWSENSEKEYFYLPPGEFTFLIKAINVYGFESEPFQYRIRILPPWYRSIPAYIIYLVFMALMVLVVLKLIRERLEEERKTLEKKQMAEIKQRDEEHAKRALIAEKQIIKLRNEKLQVEIDAKQMEVVVKNKELASVAFQISMKDEVLTNLKTKLEEISEKINVQARQHVKELIKQIDKDLNVREDWDRFEIHFDQIHGDFIKRLKQEFPELTPKDLKLCAFLRMNLATKEIAPMLNISIRGVEISRYRLRKKMNLDTDVNLTDFLLNK